MVFNFKIADNLSSQDIVLLRSILDLFTAELSWSRSVEILKSDNGSGISFTNGPGFLVFSTHIHVRNKLQVFAFLQYLHKFGILRSEASGHRG
jgi:hypothetical protein